MARKTKSSVNLLIILLAAILGLAGGFVGVVYFTLPKTDELLIGEDVYYSYSGSSEIKTAELTNEPGELSVHFLELGNKYTGDCTYIKVGNVDILIDCGSKTNSISTVSNYLKKYVTDNTLEFVIVTHAHTDHYAGFATSTSMDSIFDIFECETIITFAKTNQTNGKTYQNFVRELGEAESRGANVYDALECYNNDSISETNDQAQRQYILDSEHNITLNILYQKYYVEKTNDENNYSVCTLISQGEGENQKNFLFTGDLEADGEQSLVESNKLPKVDLYKAGHHGSKTSSSIALLEQIRPEYVCVCCCAGSPEYTDKDENQFPTQAFIDNVSKFTDKIFVTTLCINYKENEFTSFNGNIVIIAGFNKTIGISCSNNNTILKDTAWFKAHRTWPN